MPPNVTPGSPEFIVSPAITTAVGAAVAMWPVVVVRMMLCAGFETSAGVVASALVSWEAPAAFCPDSLPVGSLLSLWFGSLWATGLDS